MTGFCHTSVGLSSWQAAVDHLPYWRRYSTGLCTRSHVVHHVDPGVLTSQYGLVIQAVSKRFAALLQDRQQSSVATHQCCSNVSQVFAVRPTSLR